VLATWLWRWE